MPNAGTNGHYMQEIFMTQELCSVALHFLYCKDKLVRWWWPYAMIWEKELWSWVRDPAFLAHPVVCMFFAALPLVHRSYRSRLLRIKFIYFFSEKRPSSSPDRTPLISYKIQQASKFWCKSSIFFSSLIKSAILSILQNLKFKNP